MATCRSDGKSSQLFIRHSYNNTTFARQVTNDTVCVLLLLLNSEAPAIRRETDKPPLQHSQPRLQLRLQIRCLSIRRSIHTVPTFRPHRRPPLLHCLSLSHAPLALALPEAPL